MLYEPQKTKRYILIGASAVVLAVLVIIAAPLLYKQKTSPLPIPNLPLTAEQKKIQKESQGLDEIRESSGVKSFTTEEINQQSQKLDELRKQIVK